MFSTSERQPSLERTLQWTLGLLLTVAVAGLVVLLALFGRQMVESFVTTRLAHDAEALLASVDVNLRQLKHELPPIYRQPLSGHYYVLQFADGSELRSRSLWDASLEYARQPAGSSSLASYEGMQQQDLLTFSSGYEKAGEALTIVVAENITPLLQGLQRLLILMLLFAAGFVLLLLLIQRYLLRRAFNQLDQLRHEVRQLADGDIHMLGGNVPAEVQPIVAEFNRLALGWRQHLQRSRKAVGNLAHALKTPLSLVLERGRSAQDHAVVDAGMRMHRLMERELRQARLTGAAHALQRFEPDTDLHQLVDTIRALYKARSLEIALLVNTPEQTPFDQEDMLELCGNLLDNAAKWASSRLVLHVFIENHALHLHIEDDGEGVSDLAALSQRGMRGDESRPGHGLGLTIVQDIVDLYEGEISFAQSRCLGGLQVDVQLPLSNRNHS